MATLVLSTVGRIFGGPFGGAAGAIVGQFVDQKIFGAGKAKEGPRLKELDVQTSSYGTSIPAIFGRMRVAGTVIWSTDLIETRTSQSGGKGRPSTNIYSYSVNLAVALSSKSIKSIGRIWADGNLLRGTAGDLKVETQFRFYDGLHDQVADPIMVSALGQGRCSAHRGLAYVVFENLQLADFGNRIPQLTFEIYERDGSVSISEIFSAASNGVVQGQSFETLVGFALDGDSIKAALSPLVDFCPITIAPAENGLALKDLSSERVPMIAEAISFGNGQETGAFQERIQRGAQLPGQLSCRYYEPTRDFQLGLQTSERPGSGNAVLEVDFPAAIEAAAAKRFADLKLLDIQRARIGIEGYAHASSQIFAPGDLVTLPERPGEFRIIETEFYEGYQKLSGRRAARAFDLETTLASPGIGNTADEVFPGITHIELLDLPAIGGGMSDNPAVVVAAAGGESGWRGAALYLRQGSHLTEIGVATVPATMGQLTKHLCRHNPQLVDNENTIEIQLLHDQASLPSGTGDPLSFDAPIVSIGDELIRYGIATETGNNIWQIKSLLRGTFGTVKLVGDHASGETVVVIDKETLLPVAVDHLPVGAHLIVEASGLGDGEPVVAERQLRKLALTPRTPVHGKAEVLANGDLHLSWVRLPRVDLGWRDFVDQSIVEDAELYVIEFYVDNIPIVTRQSALPALSIPASEWAAWGASANLNLGVKIVQVGRHYRSEALEISVSL